MNRFVCVLIALALAACATPAQMPPTLTAIVPASPTLARAETSTPLPSAATRTPSSPQPFNPFANLTAEQQACLRKSWGEDAFSAITTFARPPSAQEAPTLGQCGIPPPPGAGNATPPNQSPLAPLPSIPPGASGARQCIPEKRTIAIADPNGPSFHQVLVARSSDGLNWQTDGKVIIDQASVPEALRFSDGRLAIYAVDGSGQGGPGYVYAESRDEGKSWTCGKLNFVGVGADPDIVFLSDGRLRLYSIMFPFGPGQPPAPGQSTKPNSVISAISSDGKNWSVEDGARIEGANYTDPDVIRVGDTWFIYVSTGRTALAAKSSDSLKFELIGKVNESGAVSGSYVFPDGKIRHYYCGDSGIESALSDTGGSAWKKETGTRIATPPNVKIICDPSIVSDGAGGYIMIYKIQPR